MRKKPNLDQDGELKKLAAEFELMHSEEDLREKTEAADAKATGQYSNIQRKGRPRYLIILTVVLILLGGAFFFWWKSTHKPLQPVNVPSVVGLSLDSAKANLVKVNLRVQVIYDASSQAAANTVIAQQPRSGDAAVENDVVRITIAGAAPNTPVPQPQPNRPDYPSGQSELITVPDCLGTEAARIQSKLQALGFNVELVEGSDSSHAVGVVIDCNPKPGAQIAKGSTIRITVNTLTTSLLLDYSGKPADAVIDELKKKGFVPVRTDVTTNAQPAGTVYSTEPKANTAVKSGERIIVIVAK